MSTCDDAPEGRECRGSHVSENWTKWYILMGLLINVHFRVIEERLFHSTRSISDTFACCKIKDGSNVETNICGALLD